MKRRGGFTLLELLIVMAVISALMGVIIPRLPDVTASRLKSAARKMAGSMTYLYDRAAATQLVFRMTFDMEKNEYYVSLLNSEKQFEETSLTFAKRTKLPDNARVYEARTATQGKVTKGKAVVHFFPGGYTELAVIHIADRSANEFTLVTHPLTGRVEIMKGYHDVERKET